MFKGLEATNHLLYASHFSLLEFNFNKEYKWDWWKRVMEDIIVKMYLTSMNSKWKVKSYPLSLVWPTTSICQEKCYLNITKWHSIDIQDIIVVEFTIFFLSTFIIFYLSLSKYVYIVWLNMFKHHFSEAKQPQHCIISFFNSQELSLKCSNCKPNRHLNIHYNNLYV